MSNGTQRPVCPFHYGETRQVQVRDIPNVNYMPCIPEMGATHAVTRIPNGTFIKFYGEKCIGLDDSEVVWIFEIPEMNTSRSQPVVRVLIPADSAQYLWKVGRKGVTRFR